MKIKPLVEIMDAVDVRRYAEWCGWALARAHARSGGAVMISGYLGNGSRFDDAIATFAVTYADQNERDHQALLRAVRTGKIQVHQA